MVARQLQERDGKFVNVRKAALTMLKKYPGRPSSNSLLNEYFAAKLHVIRHSAIDRAEVNNRIHRLFSSNEGNVVVETAARQYGVMVEKSFDMGEEVYVAMYDDYWITAATNRSNVLLYCRRKGIPVLNYKGKNRAKSLPQSPGVRRDKGRARRS